MVNGTRVQWDASCGRGHCWRNVAVPADIAEEIAAEMIDSGQDHCGSYRASNGQFYRW
jgi:hypothetical protein